MTHDSLSTWVRALGTEARYLSRIVLASGPGLTRVQGSIARFISREPQGVHKHESGGFHVEPILRAPVDAEDAEGRALQNPPVKLNVRERAPDVEAEVPTEGLHLQIAELEASGLLGRLLVERLASGAIIVSTHAGSDAERADWLRSLR